jgi:Domain of Unknown Function (DUF1080)
MIRTFIPGLLFFTLTFSSAIWAADVNQDLALDPEKAGPDFAIQGEYEATAGGKLGAQVIALGGGTFRVCLLTGGLPGAGWDGKDKVQSEGKVEGGKLLVSGKGFKALVDQKGLKVVDDTGNRTVTLKKIVRQSSSLGAKPPEGAIVLFNGSNVDAWNGSMDDRKLLKNGATTKRKFTSFILHLEFILPFKPYGRDQDRGNSGVYIQGRYECQVLDSFGLNGENNECGGIYSVAKPLVNMCFPPLSWQTYDVDFTAASWANGKKAANAKVTIRHNGVIIHQDYALADSTPFSDPETAEPGSLHLQDHGNPVYFRNIWLLEKK